MVVLRDRRLYMIDLSEPGAPQHIGSLPLPRDVGWPVSLSMHIDGDRLHVVERVDGELDRVAGELDRVDAPRSSVQPLAGQPAPARWPSHHTQITSVRLREDGLEQTGVTLIEHGSPAERSYAHFSGGELVLALEHPLVGDYTSPSGATHSE